MLESIDRLAEICRLRSEAVKELRDSTNALLKEKESLQSEIDTFSPIKASCERSCSSFKASLSRLKPPPDDKLYVSPILERDRILSRIEQVAAKCDEASVNYDFSAPFDSLVSMMQWFLDTGDHRWQSHQASFGILDKKYHLLEKRLEEKMREVDRLSELSLSEEEAKISRRKDAAAFFAEMENIFEQLSSQMCQMDIPVLGASSECLGGLVSVCSQLKHLDEPLLRKEEFLNCLRLAYGSMLSSLESEALKFNEELSNSKEKACTIDALKARLVSNDSQTQMLHIALQKLFDSVAHDFDQIQYRLCKFESVIGDMRSSLSQLDSALQEKHSLSQDLTSLRARNENLETEMLSKQKELELLRRTSVWSDWEQDELAAPVDGISTLCTIFLGSSPRETPDLGTNAHRPRDDTYERDKVGRITSYARIDFGLTIGCHCSTLYSAFQAQERKRFDSVDFHPLFAEPTEAEYLKNILYRYMTERELLGRESVTLAKAIAAVVKFSPSQTRLVLLKEESRSATTW
ncbi:GRIP domain containing protein [Trichuris trichiura]|uniref:GRIP domain containing protein n=1 Tax=Trichuris trichiura TaxID=36087 RepID=A0A077ZCD4_TRITR|nr:GRIP domain containing protein [Trichuris trichiura]